jgi:hypothetical protein
VSTELVTETTHPHPIASFERKGDEGPEFKENPATRKELLDLLAR